LDGPVTYLHVEHKGKELGRDLRTNGWSLIGPNLERLYQEIGGNPHHDPVWIEKPVPLHFVAQIARLPQLGDCSEACSALVTGSETIKHILSEYRKLWNSLFRPIMLGDDTVGLVIMDVECEGLSGRNSLLYIPLGWSFKSHVILVVSLDSQGTNVYKRVGLGFLCAFIRKEDGTSCLLSEVLEGLQHHRERKEIVLI
jgi:hypothetical protein